MAGAETSGTAAQLARARERERTAPLHEVHAAYDALIVAAMREGNQAVLAEALRRRAILSHEASDDAAARSGLQQSYAVATLLGDAGLAAEALNTLGGIELEAGHLVAAETALSEALSLAADRPDLTARIAQNLGIVANIRGDHAAALEHYTRSLGAYVELGDDHGCAIAQHNLGMAMAGREQWAEANGHYAQSLALARATSDAHLEALCLVNHTIALLGLGQREAARAAAETAQGIFESLESRFGLADAARVLALVELAEGRVDEAEAHLNQAITLAQETGARLTEAESARELGRYCIGCGRTAEARRLLTQAHRLFLQIGAAVAAADVATQLGALTEDPPTA